MDSVQDYIEREAGRKFKKFNVCISNNLPRMYNLIFKTAIFKMLTNLLRNSEVIANETQRFDYSNKWKFLVSKHKFRFNFF